MNPKVKCNNINTPIPSKMEGQCSGSVATIGFFDGVHQGHRFLVEQVKAEAARRGLQSLLITFDKHPLRVIRPDIEPKLLTTRDEKLQQLANIGVDDIAVLNFTRELSLMSAHEFMEKVLKDKYNVCALFIGHDHHFGHNREEGFGDYARYGQELGIDVLQAPSFAMSASTVPSSTLIRTALAKGDIAVANSILGYTYSLEGTVVSGFQNGRKLGYPTANISVASEKLTPAPGVYFVKVEIQHSLDENKDKNEDKETTQNSKLKTQNLYGMLNIGTRPTLDNGNEQSIEVHIFNFSGELYSQSLKVFFLQFIRHEQRFSSIAQLQQQLDKDAAVCKLKCNALQYNPQKV